jgi:hypothetical protein
MFIDGYSDLTAMVGWRRLFREEADAGFSATMLKYRDGRQYPLLKRNCRNQIAQDISPALSRTALRREVA